MSDEKIWMSAEEVKDVLGVHLNTVYRLAKNKQIPSVKIGLHWRFKKDDIMELFEQKD